MTDNNNLFDEPKLDEFKTESPLRAFSSFDMMGLYLVAKGFRPSMGHLTRYLDAMERKEGWQLVQIIEATTGVPTMIFRQVPPAAVYIPPLDKMDPELAEKVKAALRNPLLDSIRPVDLVFRAAYGHIDPDKEKQAKTLFERNFGAPRTDPAAWSFTVQGLDPEKVIWNRVQWRGQIDKLFDAARERPHHVKVKDFLRREEVSDMSHYYRTASVASVLRLIDMFEAWESYGLDEMITDEALFKAIGRPSASARGGCKEVTSNPVDLLENMAEDLADDLNLDVNRESFDIARKHVAEMVQLPEDVPNELREKAFEFVMERLGIISKHRDTNMREFKKSFLNPKGTPISHTRFDEQAAFILGGRYDIIAIRNCIASFNLIKALYEKIPEGVYWSDEGGNFYDRVTRKGRGQAFYDAWYERRAEFPTTPYADGGPLTSGGVPIPITSIPGDKMDDPVNPKHYDGRQCADIGERLSANGYQILKYCWRLGKKDDPCQELGKALWYLDSEITLLDNSNSGRSPNRRGLGGVDPADHWFQERIADQPEFTQRVATFLWDGYEAETLRRLKAIIADHKATLDCGHGLAL